MKIIPWAEGINEEGGWDADDDLPPEAVIFHDAEKGLAVLYHVSADKKTEVRHRARPIIVANGFSLLVAKKKPERINTLTAAFQDETGISVPKRPPTQAATDMLNVANVTLARMDPHGPPAWSVTPKPTHKHGHYRGLDNVDPAPIEIGGPCGFVVFDLNDDGPWTAQAAKLTNLGAYFCVSGRLWDNWEKFLPSNEVVEIQTAALVRIANRCLGQVVVIARSGPGTAKHQHRANDQVKRQRRWTHA